MNIDGVKWSNRFAFGVVGLLVSVVLLVLLGTEVGRAFLLFAIILLTIIFGLGWVIEVMKEAYEEYV